MGGAKVGEKEMKKVQKEGTEVERFMSLHQDFPVGSKL